MADAPDYYSVLGVSPTADRAVIHAAWKTLLRRYHPDANHGVDVSARAKEINEAFAVLGKEDARAAYDWSRLPPSSPSPTAPDDAYAYAYASHAASRPLRPRPSPGAGNSFAQPLDAHQWLVGLALLILSAAPLGMILVLYHEEARSAYLARHAADADHESQLPAGPEHPASGAKLPLR